MAPTIASPQIGSKLEIQIGREEFVIGPAGWYVDPVGTNQNRWWNGTDWTEHTSPRSTEVSRYGQQSPVVQISSQDSPRTQGRILSGRSVYGQFVAPTRWATSEAWGLVFSAWALLVAAAIVAALIFTDHELWLAAFGPSLFPVLTVVVMAYRDHRKLGEMGYTIRASWLLVFLTPLTYLIVRAAKVRSQSKRDTPLVSLYVLNVVVVTIVAVSGFLMVTQYQIRTVSSQIEQSSEVNLTAQGYENYHVVCPYTADVFSPGARLTCSVTAAFAPVGTMDVAITSRTGQFTANFVKR